MAHPSAAKCTENHQRGKKVLLDRERFPERFNRPSFDQLWERWISSPPGSREAAALASMIRSRHEQNGAESLGLKGKSESENEESGDDE